MFRDTGKEDGRSGGGWEDEKGRVYSSPARAWKLVPEREEQSERPEWKRTRDRRDRLPHPSLVILGNSFFEFML